MYDHMGRGKFRAFGGQVVGCNERGRAPIVGRLISCYGSGVQGGG